jgi:hypothetical protein
MAQASSTVYTTTAPVLTGVWVHDPSTADTSITQYPYGNVGRTEGISVSSAELRFIGRALPVYDMGGFESQNLSIKILIPSGPDEQDQADWFRSAVRNRRTLCYRDNRGRLTYGIITSIGFEDRREGTAVTFSFVTVDYTEEVV